MATVSLTPSDKIAATIILSAHDSESYTIMCSGLSGAEAVTVGLISPDGAVVTPLSAYTLDATNGATVVPGGADYSIGKPVTAANAMLSYSPHTAV